MKTKFLILLTITLLYVTSAFSQGGTTGPLSWNLNNGTLTINGAGAMPDYGCTPVPWSEYRESIVYVVIENGVTHIGNIAFINCWNLVSITIANSVTSIGHGVFQECESLISVPISKNVSSIGSKVFSYCGSLISIDVDGENNHYSSADGVLFNKDKTVLICYPGGKTGSYNIPDGVQNIEEWAFIKCIHLTDVAIPGSVKNIWDRAFYRCEGITSVIMSEGVETIGNESFAYCLKMKSINFPDGLKSIGNDAFYGCETLLSIAIPHSVTTMGNYAFYWCLDLASVTLSDNMTTINEGAFYFCRSLTSIILPKNLEKIEYGSFSDCSSLVSIVIQSSLTDIAEYAFSSCKNLTSVTNLNPTPIIISPRVFNNVNIKECNLKVPVGAIPDYKKAEVWKEFQITGNNGYTVKITINNPQYGYATGDGLYEENTNVTITATPYSGYNFVNWTKDGAEISTDNPFSFTITEDVELTANFEEKTDITTITPDTPITIYPNPTNGEFRIEMSDMGYEILEIEIFDVFGNLVSNLKSQISNHAFDLSNVPTDVYYIKIKTSYGTITRKIVKK